MGSRRVDAVRGGRPDRERLQAAVRQLRTAGSGSATLLVVAERPRVEETLSSLTREMDLAGLATVRADSLPGERDLGLIRRLMSGMVAGRNSDDPIFAGAGGLARDWLESGAGAPGGEREVLVYALAWLLLGLAGEAGGVALLIGDADRCDPGSRRVLETVAGRAADLGMRLVAVAVADDAGRIERWRGFNVVPTVTIAPPPAPASPTELPSLAAVRLRLDESGADGQDRVTLLVTLVQELIESGRPDDAGQLAEDEIAREQSRGREPDARVLVAATRASQLVIGRRDRAVELTRTLVRSASGGGGPAREYLGEIALERVNTVAAGREGVVEAGLAAIAHGGIEPAEFGRGLGWFFGCYALHLAERNHDVLAVLDRAVAEASRRRSLPDFVRAVALRSGPLFHLGHLREAAVDCELALAAGVGDLEVWLPAVRSTLIQLRTCMLDLPGAERIAAGQALGPGETAPTMLFRYGRATMRRLSGMDTEALEDLFEAGRLMADGRGDNPATMPWRSAAAAVLARRDHPGDRERAGELAAEELALARRFGSPGPVGTALWAEAMVAADPALRLDLLREAVTEHRRGERLVERIEVETEFGRALAASGRIDEARESLRHTLNLAFAAGADLLVERTREALVAAGGKPRRHAASGPDSLTPSERRVVDLAARGLTNRELAESLFLTPKTIEWHLTRAYAKLGVTGRGELARALEAPARGFRGAGGVDRLLDRDRPHLPGRRTGVGIRIGS